MARVDQDLEKPQWKIDGFKTFDDYEEHYVRLVDDKISESTTHFRAYLNIWKHNADRLEGLSKVPLIPSRGGETQTDLPMVPQAIEEAVAGQVETLPRPSAAPRQASQDEFVGALNYFMGVEMDSNDVDLIFARAVFDARLFSVGVVKQTVNAAGTGPFGQPGCLTFTHVDPRNCHFDPYAKGFKWGQFRWLVVEHPMDLSDVKHMWDRGALVEAESGLSRNETQGNRAAVIDSLLSEDVELSGKRERVIVKELWLKDDRRKFEPLLDEEGNERKDMNGDVIGAWVPMFPHGRLIITANKTLLVDQPNPFRHGHIPYTFIPDKIRSTLLGTGDVHFLGRIEDKINRLHKAMMKNALVNMNSPWVMDRNAFDSPQKFKNVTQDPGLVLPVTPGARVMRLPPAELPAFIFPFVDWLRGAFDDILGIREVNRGQLAKGAQLSMEAIGALQSAASSRVRLKSRLFEIALKEFGYQLQWNVRQFYPSQMEVEMTDPSTQEPKTLFWNDDEAQPDYAVSIEAGSSLPGSKQSMAQLSITLWREGLIGRRRALSMMELPAADAIAKERQDEIMEIAKVNLEEALRKGGLKHVARGRKPQSVNI